MEAYYYNHMNKIQQGAYHAMKTGLMALLPSFPVPKLENKELTDIFFKLRLDCPEIFYAEGFHYRFYQDASNVEMIPEYLFDKGKVKEHQKAMSARVTKLARPAANMSEREKEQYIHDFICENVHYDKLKKQYSHEIIGPLGQGVGVCEGIAKSVKILCDTLGIWCIIAISNSNLEKGIKYRHAWNIVRINGKYYHLDATFDTSVSHDDVIRQDYVNLSDKQIFRDHEPVMYPVPKCEDGDSFYYKEKKLSFTKLEDVEKRAIQAVKKGKTLVFHWRGGYMTREIVGQIMTIMDEAAAKKEKHVKGSLNWAQAVMQISFVEQQNVEEMVLETANEGEACI